MDVSATAGMLALIVLSFLRALSVLSPYQSPRTYCHIPIHTPRCPSNLNCNYTELLPSRACATSKLRSRRNSHAHNWLLDTASWRATFNRLHTTEKGLKLDTQFQKASTTAQINCWNTNCWKIRNFLINSLA